MQGSRDSSAAASLTEYRIDRGSLSSGTWNKYQLPYFVRPILQKSQGKSAIIKLLNRYDKKRILVIADAAALGSEIRDLLQYKSESDNRIDFFLPESFEWLILRSAIFYNNNDIQKILSDPVEHIECQEYFSWERFFTALLVSSTKDKINLEYHKDKNRLPSGYLSETNINKILNAMKNN